MKTDLEGTYKEKAKIEQDLISCGLYIRFILTALVVNIRQEQGKPGFTVLQL